RDLGRTQFRIAEIKASQHDLAIALEEIEKSQAIHLSLWHSEPTSTMYARDLSAAQSLGALLEHRSGQAEGTLSKSEVAYRRMRAPDLSHSKRSIALDAAMISHRYGTLLEAHDYRERAQEAYQWGLSQLPSEDESGTLELAVRHQLQYSIQSEQVRSVIVERLSSYAFNDPRFPALLADDAEL
ncbi:MAG: hypothetical protein AAF385_15065, partial [Pseudomonadota bacterium]